MTNKNIIGKNRKIAFKFLEKPTEYIIVIKRIIEIKTHINVNNK